MEDYELKRARDEAASAIKLAHQLAEIVGWLVGDMRAAQVLTPQTSTKILQLLTEDSHSVDRSKRAMSKLRERFLQGGQSALETEMKRDPQWKPRG
jgi:hypothetical protein